MKKIFLYIVCALAVGVTFSACSDDDDDGAYSDKLFRTMFRTNETTGKGDDDPYNCTVVDRNNIHLYWYSVDNAAGYHIKWALESNVSGGETAWNSSDSLGLVGDTIIPAGQNDCVLEHLNYQTKYAFAIQTLHSMDLNDPLNSGWYGVGDLRHWADYLKLETDARYDVPTITQISNITKTSMRVNLNRSIAGYTADQMAGFREHFTDDGTNFKVDYMTITPSVKSVNAVVPEKYQHYQLTEDDWNRGYIDVDGLTENSQYNIDVWDEDIPIKVDASYNPWLKRTKGDAGPPILIEHVATAQDTIGKGTDNEVVYDISRWNSMKLDNILESYCASSDLAENQVFYLEGGKAYHCIGNVSIYKGLTLETNPADIAAGKGKAKLYLNGITQTGNSVNTCNFMIGRQPEGGENSAIPLDIDSVRFINLDVDAPLATNFGHKEEGISGASGNYFMNMYSNGMGINVTTLEWIGCSFQGLVRGFFRVQGSNDFTIHNMVIKDCDFYNSGYYAQNGGGYNWIHADLNKKPKSNILENVLIENNTFYDSPKGCLITDAGRNVTWDGSIRWNIKVINNTFVNFQTESGASDLLYLRYMPGGSSVTVKNNYITVTADAADNLRPLRCAGSYIQKVQGGDGSGKLYFDISNNWCTNNNLTGTSVFTKDAFSAQKNSIGTFLKNGNGIFADGGDDLDLHVDNISATDLMVSPNPPHHIGTTRNHLDHHVDNLNGLYFKSTDAVYNSNIYKLGIGASKWRNGQASSAKRYFHWR